jgi:Uma2 family endonuclease
VDRGLADGLRSRAGGRPWLCNDPGLLLSRDPDTVRAPDLAYYRENVRLEEISPGLAKRLPDLVVEVLSPSDRLGMVMRKVQQYLRAGIAMVWVVDGESRNVTVYRAGREPRVLEENESAGRRGSAARLHVCGSGPVPAARDGVGNGSGGHRR